MNRSIPYSSTGESWDVSNFANDISVVSNGDYAGTSLASVIASNPVNVLGTRIDPNKRFPLLIKIISAQDDLSVQVHPDDAYAQENEHEPYGKGEMWYVLKAPDTGRLIIGLKEGATKDNFKQRIYNDDVYGYLNELKVEEGDLISIPAGLVHAITKGAILVEIQQSSKRTYRIYDYGREDAKGNKRELHIDKAMDVIKFDNSIKIGHVRGIDIVIDDNKLTYLIANEHFIVIKYDILDELAEFSDPSNFFLFTCVQGGCCIQSNGYEYMVNVGDSFLVPAAMGAYTLKGKCILLKSFVGNKEKDFLDILKSAGYDLEQIDRLCSL